MKFTDLNEEIITLLRENKALKEENELLKEHRDIDQKSLNDSRNFYTKTN